MAQSKTIQENLKKISAVKKGQSVLGVASSERMNAIQELLQALVRGDNVVTGVNLRKTLGPGYFILSGEAGGGRGGGPGAFPWEITTTFDPDAVQNSVHVRPGTINSFLPTNMFDEFDIEPTGTYYVTLDCTTDGTSVTDASIDVVNTAPDPIGEDIGAAPDFFQVLLGVIVDLRIYQLIDYVLFAFPVRTLYSLTEDPEPGQPYYDLHYTWQINPDPA